MTEPWDKSAQSGALWRRWSDAHAAAEGRAEAEEPDALSLAAYAEGRLGEDERHALETLLARRPELAADVAMARRLAAAEPSGAEALAAVIVRASALVPASGDRVVALRPRRPGGPGWRSAARWSALAASFALVGYLGLALGIDASTHLAAPGVAAAVADEMLDPPSGFLGGSGETGST